MLLELPDVAWQDWLDRLAGELADGVPAAAPRADRVERIAVVLAALVRARLAELGERGALQFVGAAEAVLRELLAVLFTGLLARPASTLIDTAPASASG